MVYKDKDKQLEAQRKWYHKNKYKQDNWKKIRMEKIRKWYIDYKYNLKCFNCPENDSRCLDFHHIQDKKIKCVSTMVNHGYSIDNIKKEIEKCIVLCSNCHRKETLIET